MSRKTLAVLDCRDSDLISPSVTAFGFDFSPCLACEDGSSEGCEVCFGGGSALSSSELSSGTRKHTVLNRLSSILNQLSRDFFSSLELSRANFFIFL